MEKFISLGLLYKIYYLHIICNIFIEEKIKESLDVSEVIQYIPVIRDDGTQVTSINNATVSCRHISV